MRKGPANEPILPRSSSQGYINNKVFICCNHDQVTVVTSATRSLEILGNIVNLIQILVQNILTG